MSQVTFIDTAAASIATPVAGKDSLYVNDLGNLAKKSSAGVSVVYATTGTAFTPTGTGIPHVVGGVMNAAASLILAADIGALDYLGIGATAVWPLDVTKAATAAAAVAYGARLQQTLTAAANNDVLSGLFIKPTFADGGFTGVKHNIFQFQSAAAAPLLTLLESGFLGINVATPSAMLTVRKNGAYNDSTLGLRFENESTPTQALYMGYDFSLNRGYIQSVHDGVAYTGLLLNPNGGPVGIGLTVPTTGFILDVVGRPRFTDAARFVAVAAPTVVEGDLWNDSTGKNFMGYLSGIKQALTGSVFQQTADATVTQATDTSLIGTGKGTMTLPANFWTVGKTVHVKHRGRMGAAIAATQQFKVKQGATTLADSGAVVVAGALTNAAYEAEFEICCRTVGATGTLSIRGVVEYNNGITRQSVDLTNAAAGPITFDTTAAGLLDLTLAYGAVVAANTTTSTNTSAEVIGPVN